MRTGSRFIRSAGIVVAAIAIAFAAIDGAAVGTHGAAEAAAGTPADVIAAGGNETCLVENGAAWCQGYNNNGQLGNDSTADSWMPVQVSNAASGVSAIAVGDAHACAVQNGGVVCWGDNVDGQLGNSSVLDVHHPVPVSGLGSGVKGIAVGAAHSCALTNGGAVWCWGAANKRPAGQRKHDRAPDLRAQLQPDAGRGERPGQRRHGDQRRWE